MLLNLAPELASDVYPAIHSAQAVLRLTYNLKDDWGNNHVSCHCWTRHEANRFVECYVVLVQCNTALPDRKVEVTGGSA